MILSESIEAGRFCDGREDKELDAVTLPTILTPVPFPQYPDDWDSQWYAGEHIGDDTEVGFSFPLPAGRWTVTISLIGSDDEPGLILFAG